MNPAYVTVQPLKGSDGFMVVTSRPDIVRASEPTASKSTLESTRDALQSEVTEALMEGREYRGETAETLLNNLSWGATAHDLARNPSPYIRYTFVGETLWIPPEMVSVGDKWLDKIAPSYRVFNISSERAPDKRDPRIALIYMEGDREFNFQDWAQAAERQLKEHGLIPALFPGKQLACKPKRRTEQLQYIFHEHRVVWFLGHLLPDEKNNYGWALTPGSILTMEELTAFFGSTVRDGREKRNPAPEVVFSGCCAGAGQDPSKDGWPGVVYPKVFIEGGVRFFVGAWMDAIGPREQGQEFLKEHVIGLAINFFRRWVREPDHAIYHLYDAKQDLGFHLIDSLFHIYAPSTHEPPLRGQSPDERVTHHRTEPHGGVISAIAERTRLGSYELLRQVWSDSVSKTFWATSDRGNHLVQVLSDEWQGNEDLARRVNLAIQKLEEHQLGEGHLSPTRSEVCVRQVGDSRQMQLVIVYDRAEEETADSWSLLRDLPLNPLAQDHFVLVMDLSKALAERIFGMHEKKLRHGNISPSCLVFHRDNDGKYFLVLKDAWQWLCRPNQRLDDRYTPPEERRAPPNPDELKGDCWAFGAVLYEIATGTALNTSTTDVVMIASIRRALQSVEHRVPEALEQIVKECLMPSASLRPSAQQIVARLVIGHSFGRTYRNEFEANLFRGLHAGQRLFGISAVDREDFESTLRMLEDYGHPVFIFEPGRGIVRYRDNHVVRDLEWLPARLIEDYFRQQGEPLTSPLTGDEELAFNANILLPTAIEQLRIQKHVHVPLIVIFGGFPWAASPMSSKIAIMRLLKACEGEYLVPAVIVTFSQIFLRDEPLPPPFHWLHFPPLAPADLFERIISAPVEEALSVPPIGIEQANEIADRLYPIGGRRLSYVLRLAALEYGVIDERVAEVRDFELEQAFRDLRTVTYFPVAMLPPDDEVGLLDETRVRVLGWVDLVKAASEAAIPAPQRLLVQGPEGYGKTTVTLMLGGLTRRPVVRVEISRCLGRNLGDSERVLRRTLGYVKLLPGALVLFEDIDSFLSISAEAAATLQRMSGIILRWMDDLPPHVAVVLTVKKGETLPPQWQRRMQFHVPLDRPVGLQDGDASNVYRAQVFKAIFRKHRLELARNMDFLIHLGTRTNPSLLDTATLHSPMALFPGNEDLMALKVTLDTAAAINTWVEEVLLLHAQYGDPETVEFWEEKLR